MRKTERIAAVALLLLAVLSLYGVWATRRQEPAAATQVKKPSKAAAPVEQVLVDQSPLTTAQQLAQLAAMQEERPLAAEALRLSDYDVQIAFQNAIRQARLHPPPLSAEAKECKVRQEKAEQVLDAEQERVKQLEAADAKAPESKKDAIESDLIQAQADLDLAQDEVNDAKHDLRRAGGDLVGQLEALQEQHKQSSHGTSSAVPTGPEPPDQPGLIHRLAQWRSLHQKQMQLWQAKAETDVALAALVVKHNALDEQVDAEKAAVPELAHHAKKTKSAPAGAPAPPPGGSQTDSASLLKKTQELADNQKVLSAFDERIDTKKELSSLYGQWIDIVRTRQREELHGALLGAVIILGIVLALVVFNSWMDSLVNRLSVDRRQLQSLHTVARVGLQFVGLLLVLLVIFGPPGQLGTFLGLAGAGLTVALKDFIVGFLGWFVLMGKNGIRLGDWVEINGVTGEVVQIGPFHTVLFETGNWTDSGHPTGRRVTFTNSYAIEGHYFNFSTTGQWLWDELQIVLPVGQDPYPVIDAIQKKVLEATRESTEQAEKEWKGSTTSREMSGFSAQPAISVKPVVGGIEIAVRYITRANERYAMRSKLNQEAVELLGGKSGSTPA